MVLPADDSSCGFEQNPVALCRNVSLGTATGWLVEFQQPAAALAPLTIRTTVLVTTIVWRSINRAIRIIVTIRTTILLS